MDLELAGKVVVITGSSQGIGRATAFGFAKEGAKLVLAARGLEGLQEVSKTALEAGAQDVAIVQCDVTVDADVEQLMASAVQRFGRIDVLVNNAAGKLPAGDFTKITNEEWLNGYNQKLQCHIRACRAVFPIMRDQKSGVVINILGTAARNPETGYMAVGVSNAGLYNFNKSFADFCAPYRIRVVGVAPSNIATSRWERLINLRAPAEGKTPEQLMAETNAALPLGRMGAPEDIADAVCFAASARASYISGSVITVDGDRTRGVYL